MINEVEILINCPVCGKKYSSQSAQVVTGKKDSLLVHVNCGHCKSASLAIISKGNGSGNAITVGMLTDLDYEESKNMFGLPAIGADEVLDVFENKLS